MATTPKAGDPETPKNDQPNLAIVRTSAPAFDYSSMKTELAAMLRTNADQIRKRLRTTTEDLIVIGRGLNDAKERLEHGQFVQWVESAEIGITLRSAQRFMRVARLADA